VITPLGLLAAVSLMTWPAAPAFAANYSVSDEAALRQAILDANADPDPNATITLTGNITLSSTAAFAALTKPVTIDTNGFTLSGLDQTAGPSAGGGLTFSGTGLTLSGTFRGGDANPASINAGGNAVTIGAGGSVRNTGSITGGTGGATPGNIPGGTGLVLTAGASAAAQTTAVNDGVITGGLAPAINGKGGVGAILNNNTALINNGTIRGGAGDILGAQAVIMNGTSTLTNHGTIQGASGTGNNPFGADPRSGVYVGQSGTTNALIVNDGTIEGGDRGRAIYLSSSTQQLTIVNSGTIRAGVGQANAIDAAFPGTQPLTLELRAGSTIVGNVVASSGANDIFRLGGDANSSFDVSTIGAAAQYRRFDTFQKSGTSTWTLTGTTSAVTPWQIQGGTLSVSSDANLGGAAGGLTLNGTLQNTAAFTSARAITSGLGTIQTDADLTLSGTISGGGTLTKTGNATLTRTGTGGPSTWNLLGGTLSVSSVGQMGTFNFFFGGGTLRITAPVTYTRGTTLNAGGGTFRTDADLTLMNSVLGTGSLTKTGPATLILGGSLGTWSGGTTITEGTLQIGSGGVAGLLPGDVLNNATLAFNKTNALTIGGLISGSGAVIQRGTGTTTLAGNNTYTGATTVQSGTLRINGDQSAATGLVSVASGATLGGSGIIGGAVTVADGGHLAPGNSPGTLTMGSLTLSGGSVLDFELGEANTVGGTFNDLVNVNGDLTLDGTLNVSLAAGGSYGAGIYRLVNYSGTLTDNGLDLGLMPASSINSVQTSVANQVNLINSQGLVLNYWDGGAATRNDGHIAGGDGTWIAAPGNDNWALADGSINALYQDASIAIFTGTAGTVTVDASLGDISVSGMQFASDGYRIQGDAITLNSGGNAIRVGDGTDAGAAFRATIDSELSGDGTLDKTDLGTLVLTGENTYSGGTIISAGTLQLGDGGTAGSLIGDVTNNGTLAFDRSDALTIGGVISGGGVVRQSGTGTTVLTGVGSTAGSLEIEHGTLELASGASLAAVSTTVAAGTTLRNEGTLTGTTGDNTFTLEGALIGRADLLDGNDAVQIAAGASYSQAAFDGGDGVDTLDLTSGAALTLSPTFATNFEHLVKRGNGTFTMSGTVDEFRDSITIAAGNVQLANASIVTDQMNVESGVTVTGTGSLSGSLMNAGLLSPGNSPGTLVIGGSYVQDASGTLVSQITRTGTDLLDVAGTAALAGTHQIQVEYGLYLDGTTQTLIAADGGISGDFGSVQMNASALMTADRQLGSNALAVSFERQSFTSITDPNTGRGRYAEWIEERIAAGDLSADLEAYIDTLLQQPTAAGVRDLLGQLAEPVGGVSQNSISILGAGFARSVFERFSVADTAYCTPAQGASDALNCFWAHGLRQWGDADGDRFGPQYDWTAEGGQIGVDRALASNWSVGASFGYADSDVRDVNGGRNELRSRMGGLYANYAAGPLSFAAMTFYSDNDNRTTRDVVIGTTVQQARAEFDADSYGMGARLGYRLTSDSGPLVRPFIEAFYDRIEGARFTEREGGEGNLSARVHDREGLRGLLGLQLAESYEAYGRVFRPALEVGVSHQFGDTRSTLELQPFDGTQAFRTYGSALDRTAYVARASLDVSLGASAVLTLGYGGELADDYSQHEGNVSFRVAW
jgi:fibronectin-binding autotransporter adhesin